jgi:hypothetical protein
MRVGRVEDGLGRKGREGEERKGVTDHEMYRTRGGK